MQTITFRMDRQQLYTQRIIFSLLGETMMEDNIRKGMCVCVSICIYVYAYMIYICMNDWVTALQQKLA